MAAELPIRQIVLYKSGVGYFERAGALHEGEAARLDFNAVEMDDVLKSLTLVDSSGAKISGLRYDSSEPLAEKLAVFPFHVDGAQSLGAFLDQMKGATVELKFGSETVTGTIVSGRHVAAGDKTQEREQAVLLLDAGELRTLDLGAATSLRFTDANVQAQLRDYLSAVNQSRSQNKRSVYIDSSDSKARQISASYMIPMPVWKSSYRLIFGAQGEPMLEGWAIVDNTTGEDWNGVSLAVVSGRPVSFISRLYEPKFLQRPMADLPEDTVQGPLLHEGAMEQFSRLEAAAPVIMRSMRVGAAKPKADAASSIAVNTESRDLGDLFEYRFSSPVTVKKNESTMLPFVQQRIGARKLLIYSESYGANPMSAVELTNSTGKTLDGGPITVFETDSYSGEALLATLRPNDKRLVSYAVDLGTRVGTKLDSTQELTREIHAGRGVLTFKLAVQETKTFTIRNVDDKAKTLLIEHPLRAGYTLLQQRPAETTANAYRFEVKLAPASSSQFPVVEEKVYSNTVSVSSLTGDVLIAYAQNKTLGEPARRQLEQIAAWKRQIAENDEALQQNKNQINELVQDQDRIRQNLTSLNAVSGQQEQVQKYSRQLADEETRLAGLRDRGSELAKAKTGLVSKLNAAIETLAF